MSKPSDNSRPPFSRRAAVVTMHRTALRLSVEQLAELAEVSTKSIYELERGDVDMGLNVLAPVSWAMGLDLELLRYDPASHPMPPRRAGAAIGTAKPYERLSNDHELQKFLELFASLIKATDQIVRISVRRGSTIIIVSMSHHDIYNMAEAFVEGFLSPLQIIVIQVLQNYEVDERDHLSALFAYLGEKLGEKISGEPTNVLYWSRLVSQKKIIAEALNISQLEAAERLVHGALRLDRYKRSIGMK
jgi:transcriptional regulator with XRE-family HTH domain